MSDFTLMGIPSTKKTRHTLLNLVIGMGETCKLNVWSTLTVRSCVCFCKH
ncbi:hypothetical protein DsansV1_C02g0022931 [Dioscorea sansibarensis]